MEVKDRVQIFVGLETLEIDLFPSQKTNKKYLEQCFINLGHKKSFDNLQKINPDKWNGQLITRIDETVKKGRFAQELSLLIDKEFVVPNYIEKALHFIIEKKGIRFNAE